MPANDPYRDRVLGASSQPRRAVAVTPSDTVDLPEVARCLWIGTDGDIAVILADDTEPQTYGNVSGRFPTFVKRVLATGTTATRILAEY